MADRSAFRQVLLNLISNAIKFTPAEGRIVVRGDAGNGEIRIAVADDGPGIAPADLARLGEAFYQAGPKNDRGQGTGLGLAIRSEAHTSELQSLMRISYAVFCLKKKKKHKIKHIANTKIQK